MTTVGPIRIVQLAVDTSEMYGAFSADCSRLLTGSDGCHPRVQVWDLNKEKCLHTLFGHIEPITAVTWSNNQNLVASGSYDGAVRIWDVKTGECYHLLSHLRYVRSLEFSFDGRHLLVGVGSTTRSVAWSPSCKSILSASHDRTVRIWDVETANEDFLLDGHKECVVNASWATESTVCSCDSSGVVCFWNLATPENTRPGKGL